MVEAARDVEFEVEQRAGRPASPWGVAMRRLLHKRLALAALLAIGVFYVVGLGAPVAAPYDFRDQDLDQTLQGPSWEHPFGTDRLGRDQLSRVIWSARTTIFVTLATLVTGSLVLSVGLGLLSGYLGGKVDTAVMRTGEVFASLPALPMLILINATMRERVDRWVDWLESHISTGAMRAAVESGSAPDLAFLLLLALLAAAGIAGLGAWLLAGEGRRNGAWLLPGAAAAFVLFCLWAVQGIFATEGASDYFLIFGALSLFFWVGGARVIRSQVLALRETEYVLAARSMGASTWRIIGAHLLPNVSPIIIVSVSASLGAIAGSEIALTFLGVGIREPTPSFGAMIFDAAGSVTAIRSVEKYPHLLLIPAAVIGILIFAFNLLGDALNDVFTPRAR
jgi:ABC-type dipeptide/oligopeptide/nickel transport system permease subunit